MVARECLPPGSMNTLCIHWSMTPLVLRSSSVNSHQKPRHWLSEWVVLSSSKTAHEQKERKQSCHPPDACCTNLSLTEKKPQINAQNFKCFKRLSIRACKSHTKMQSIINFMWLCCSESLLCFSWYVRLGLCMASSSFSFLVLWTLWARIIKSVIWEREKKYLYHLNRFLQSHGEPASLCWCRPARRCWQQPRRWPSHGPCLHSFPKYRRRTCESCHSLQRYPNRPNCLAPASSSSSTRWPSSSSSSSQECYNWSKECVSRDTSLSLSLSLSLCAAERKTLQTNSNQHSIDMMMISKRQSQSTSFSPLLLLRCCCYYSSLKAPIQTCCWRFVIITRQEEAPRRILQSNLLLVPWKNHQK